jgi:hypothetical protein
MQLVFPVGQGPVYTLTSWGGSRILLCPRAIPLNYQCQQSRFELIFQITINYQGKNFYAPGHGPGGLLTIVVKYAEKPLIQQGKYIAI